MLTVPSVSSLAYLSRFKSITIRIRWILVPGRDMIMDQRAYGIAYEILPINKDVASISIFHSKMNIGRKFPSRLADPLYVRGGKDPDISRQRQKGDRWPWIFGRVVRIGEGAAQNAWHHHQDNNDSDHLRSTGIG